MLFSKLVVLIYIPPNSEGGFPFSTPSPEFVVCRIFEDDHFDQWALESTIMSKVSQGDRILVKLFQILKNGAVKLLLSICQQIWKTQQWPQDWKRSVFIPIPKKGNAKESSNYCTIAFISHAS